MVAQRLIVAIGRIERALSSIEQSRTPSHSEGNGQLVSAHQKLKSEMAAAIAEIDQILAGGN